MATELYNGCNLPPHMMHRPTDVVLCNQTITSSGLLLWPEHLLFRRHFVRKVESCLRSVSTKRQHFEPCSRVNKTQLCHSLIFVLLHYIVDLHTGLSLKNALLALFMRFLFQYRLLSLCILCVQVGEGISRVQLSLIEID